MVTLCKQTNDVLNDKLKTTLFDELIRKHGNRPVYSAYVQGYIRGLIDAKHDGIYKFLEFCYFIDGVLFTTSKTGSKRKVEEFYLSNNVGPLNDAPARHYWIDTDKPF